LLTVFFVTLFRKSDDKSEMDNDGDDGRKLNEWNGIKNVSKHLAFVENLIYSYFI